MVGGFCNCWVEGFISSKLCVTDFFTVRRCLVVDESSDFSFDKQNERRIKDRYGEFCEATQVFPFASKDLEFVRPEQLLSCFLAEICV